MEIRRILAQITPEQVEEGYFTFDGKTLRSVDRNGKPVTTEHGFPIERFVSEKEDPEAVARAVIRDGISDFNRPINYGNRGWR